MSRRPTVLAFAGSARRESFNKRVVAIGAAAAEEAGASVTRIDLADFPLPILDQDCLEAEGFPEHAIRLKELFLSHDALLIACPEYNSSITPLLKNVIDWVSRAREGEGPLACFQGKVCGLLSASSGRLGGLRGLAHVRAILSNIGVLVIPEQAGVPMADKVLVGDELQDDALRASIRRVGERVAYVGARLGSD
jgi:NAD(P)H-dependent FMN reductase